MKITKAQMRVLEALRDGPKTKDQLVAEAGVQYSAWQYRILKIVHQGLVVTTGPRHRGGVTGSISALYAITPAGRKALEPA